MCLTVIIVPPLTTTLGQGHLQKVTTIRASLLGPVHHVLYCQSTFLGHPNIAQIVRGWEDNLASHLTSTWSWRWHPRLGGWCIQYPWLFANIERNILPPRGQLTPTTTFHMALYQTPFWSLENNNKMVFFLPCSVLSEFAIWKVGQ